MIEAQSIRMTQICKKRKSISSREVNINVLRMDMAWTFPKSARKLVLPEHKQENGMTPGWREDGARLKATVKIYYILRAMGYH